jgi:probable F420-dependent oxidoreductase
MQFAVQIPVDKVHLGDVFTSAHGIVECATHVESAGFNACFVTDHPVPEDKWLATGGHHSFDPFVALTLAASCTRTLKLMTNIIVLPYRNPFLVAKSAASLDIISNGRLILGTGAGYLEGEFKALGVQVEQRGQRMEEAYQAMKLAWTGESFTYHSKEFEAAGNTALPRPLQKPHPPIWIGGNSKAAMRRAAQYCDGWLPMPVPKKLAGRLKTQSLSDMEALQESVNNIRQIESQFDRIEPLDICMIPFGMDMRSELEWNSQDLIEQIQQMQMMGVTWINVTLPCESKQLYRNAVSWFAEEVISKVQC